MDKVVDDLVFIGNVQHIKRAIDRSNQSRSHKEYKNEESELHRELSEEYDTFLRMVMNNADLLLMSRTTPPPFSEEQRERTDIIFRMLVSLFEKAYIILYDDTMDKDARRRWSSWEDDMVDWCARADFRALLPDLLEGEDDAFSAYIQSLADKAAAKAA